MGVDAGPIDPWQIKTLAVDVEWRGADATGIALVDDDGSIVVDKDHEIASKYMATPRVERWLEDNLKPSTRLALVHTRKYTVGSPYQNKNNHPLYAGAGTIIHNGSIHNHGELFNRWKLDRSCDTDSDIIRAIVDDHKRVDLKMMDRLNQMNGGVASAIVHPNSPGKMLLLRSGNPLYIGMCEDKFYFASDKRAIFSAAKPWTKHWGFWAQIHRPEIAFLEMEDDSAWLIGDDGLEAAAEFHPSYNNKVKVNYKVYDGYAERHERLAKEAEPTPAAKTDAKPVGTMVGFTLVSGRPINWRCPNHLCGQISTLRGRHTNARKYPLDRLQCGKCSTNLSGAHAVPDSTMDALNLAKS